MSLPVSCAIVRFRLAPSPSLAAAILAAHCAAAASAWTVLQGAPGVLLAGALATLGAAAAWSRALLRSKSSVRCIEVAGEKVVLEFAGGRRVEAGLGARRYVSRFAVMLPVRRPFRRTILITPGMLGRDDFRRLRLWALWGRLPAHAAPAAAL